MEDTFKECREFFDKLTYAYKIQGVKIPISLKNVKDNVNKQIKNIEGDSCGK